MVVHDDAAVHRRGRLPGLPRDGSARRQPGRPDLSLGRVGRHTRPAGRLGYRQRDQRRRFDRTQSHLHAARRQPDRAILPDALPAARGEQADGRRAGGDPLRRLGAERAERRAGPWHGRRRAFRGTARRLHRSHLTRWIHLERRPRRRRDDPDAPRRRRHLVDGGGGCARARRLRRLRPHALHVPDHQGRRQRRLPHRPLLPLPDRQRRYRPGGAERELERLLSRPRRIEKLLGGGRPGASDRAVRRVRPQRANGRVRLRPGWRTGLAGDPLACGRRLLAERGRPEPAPCLLVSRTW